MNTTARKKVKRASPEAVARRRRRRQRFAMRLMVLLVIVGAVVCSLVFFKIQEIKISGVFEKYTRADILDALSIDEGDSLLLMSPDGVANKLVDDLPYLSSCEVIRELSGVVTVKVEESFDFGAVRSGSSYIVVDRDLKIIDVVSKVPGGSAVIYGFDASEPKIGKYLSSAQEEGNEDQLKQLLTALFDAELGGEITAIGIADKLNIDAVYDGRIYIEFGTINSIEYKVEMLCEAVNNRLAAEDEGSLDLATPGKGIFSPEDITDYMRRMKKS